MNKNKIIYWISTGLLSLLMIMSAGMYIFNHEMIITVFQNLGYPSYIVYPLAIAKLLGIIAILTRKSNTLKEWAYVGFFFDFILAFSAHFAISDGEYGAAIVALILLAVSYIYDKKVFGNDLKKIF